MPIVKLINRLKFVAQGDKSDTGDKKLPQIFADSIRKRTVSSSDVDYPFNPGSLDRTTD